MAIQLAQKIPNSAELQMLSRQVPNVSSVHTIATANRLLCASAYRLRASALQQSGRYRNGWLKVCFQVGLKFSGVADKGWEAAAVRIIEPTVHMPSKSQT